MVLEGANDDPQSKKREAQADKYAADILIPVKKYKEFIRQGSQSPDNIQGFAEHIGIKNSINNLIDASTSRKRIPIFG